MVKGYNSREPDSFLPLRKGSSQVGKDKLYLTAYIRSNDMVKAWVENAYGLRRLQKFISLALGVPMGTLVIISCSAHIYESDISTVKKILDENTVIVPNYNDLRGNFVITITNDLINLQLMDNDKLIGQWIGSDAKTMTMQLNVKNVISNPYHCMYLGRELQKAENCLLSGEKYVQD